MTEIGSIHYTRSTKQISGLYKMRDFTDQVLDLILAARAMSAASLGGGTHGLSDARIELDVAIEAFDA